MLPGRFGGGPSSAMRKSRLEGKPSLLPKPRRPGSTDRLSTEARRPSAAGHRSSSAEPARGTFGGGRLSREASATKLPLNGRSRSQTGEARYGQSTTTPLRSSHYSRPTTTPVRTPTDDRNSRSWQTSLERALAFVTIKDQRPVASVAWQRAEGARVGAALGARGAGAALVRPLTIARFVDLAAALLAALTRDAKLNTDNYVTKLPHLAKRLLYPGAVSKSWLRTVNTLHAFPHALALLAYLLDLVNHVETPVLDEWLYVGKDELSCLRRDYLYKCWIRFQDPGHQFEDLNEEYLQNLTQLLGNDEKKIADLEHVIEKYEACLGDEVEVAARLNEVRRKENRDNLLSLLRAERAASRHARADIDAQRLVKNECVEMMRAVDVEIERASVEAERLRGEVERQPLSVAARERLAAQLDYLQRVLLSKRTLADQVSQMVVGREAELAAWQQRTLDGCLRYKRALVHLSACEPRLAHLDVDEKHLMEAESVARIGKAVETLKEEAARLAGKKAELARTRTAQSRKRVVLLEESRAKITELKAAIEREQQVLDGEVSKEAAEAAAWGAEERELAARFDTLMTQQEEYARVDADLDFWEKQDLAWRTRLSTMRDYIESKKEESQRLLEASRMKKMQLILDNVKLWNEKLVQ